MSWENVEGAYATRLGNATAKSVWVRLAHEADADGLAFVGIDRLVALTEVNKRTVLRLVQVFAALGLLSRTEAFLKGRLLPAFRVDVTKLGADLRGEFAQAYAAAQGKPGATRNRGQRTEGKCRSDAAASVAATWKSVAATRASVAATQPPHPLIGGPFLVPVVSHPPQPPVPGGVAPNESRDQAGLNAEQLAHLATVADAKKRSEWESFYREDNAAKAKAAEQERAEADELAALQVEMATPEAARDWVMRRCGFTPSRRGRGLEAVIDAVLRQDLRAGTPLWETAPKMAAAWNKYARVGDQLDVHYGPANFLRLSIWRDERCWAWNKNRAREMEARVGTR